MEKELKILEEGLKHITTLMLQHPKYYEYDKEKLESVVMQYNDIIEHTNVFLIELNEVK